jgi:hypothetical protein
LQLLDQENKKILIKEGVLPAIVQDPVRLITPLPPAEEAAADAADKESLRIEGLIRAIDEHPAPRALNCGTRRSVLHLRRPVPGTDQVEDLLLRPRCGRSECPSCWRRRVTRTLRRMARCLLDAPPEPDEPGKPGLKNLPRLGPVYIGETDWLRWETFDKAVRRAVGGDCGRIRIRRTNNSVLLISALPFPSSRPVTPAEASRLASAAIDNLHTAKHSYRQLGDWSDGEAAEWTLLARHSQLDLEAIKQMLAELGVKARKLKSRSVAGLLWRTDSAMKAEALAALVCPTFAKKETDPPRANSDKSGFDEGETPFDDPENNQWH